MKLERHLAKKVDDWVRFELEIKSYYAHDITQKLLSCNSPEDEKNLILSTFLDKYMLFFVKSRKPHKVTKLMLEALDEKSYKFPTIDTRNSELNRSIEHIEKGSGLFPILYKIKRIWDDDAVDEFMEYLKNKFRTEFIPNPDHLSWINKNIEMYRYQGKPWEVD